MNRAIFKKGGIRAAAAIFALLLALGQSRAYAADDSSSSAKTSSSVKTKIISSVKHVENFYNAFGVCYMSTESSRTVTETTGSSTANGETKTNSSTTVQESFVMQTWKGGSLKPDYSTSTSTTEGTDGSSSVTTSKVTYSYDATGKLAGAIGTAHTEGTLASDVNGESGGNYVSDQTTTYIIKNAQALPSQTVTNTTSYLEGQVKSTSTEVTTFEYELIGGSWHLMSEVSNSSTSMTDGGSETRTTTKTYSRDANGVCTGISQTSSGTSVSVSETGGTTTYTMSNYNAVFEFDEQNGWYLASESYDWVLTDNADTSSAASATQNVASANEKLVENSGSGASDDSGSDPAASPENAGGDTRKIMPVYNEKRQTELENQILKFKKAAQQREEKSAEEVSAFHKKSRQQQAELEKQLEDFRRASKERRNEINRQIERFERNFGVQFHHFLYN